MAIRKRHGVRGLAYQVYWNNPYTGSRESRTFHRLAEARKHDSLIRHQLEFETENFKPESFIREGAERTIEETVFLYLRDKRFPGNQTAKFLASIRLALEFDGHIPLKAFSTAVWDELVKRLKNTEKQRGGGLLSSAFIHGILSRLRTVIRWAHEREMLSELPRMKVPAPNYERTIPPTPEEAQRIFSAAPEHLKRVIVLGMLLGLRVGSSELLALKWSHVDLIQNLVIIDTSRKNPNAPWREAPIPAAAQDMFKEWAKTDAAIGIEYAISYKGKPVGSIKKAWAASLHRAGITRRIRPYDLRHAFASQLIANGCDVGTVAHLMGHSSPQMVFRHYQHISTLQKREAVNSLQFSPQKLPCAQSMCPTKKALTKPIVSA